MTKQMLGALFEFPFHVRGNSHFVNWNIWELIVGQVHNMYVYVYMQVCKHVCIYVCIYVCMYMCMLCIYVLFVLISHTSYFSRASPVGIARPSYTLHRIRKPRLVCPRSKLALVWRLERTWYYYCSTIYMCACMYVCMWFMNT